MNKNDLFEKIGDPVSNVVDSITNAYPNNADLELASESEEGAVVVDANSLKRNRNILAGFLTLVFGGLSIIVVFLVFTASGRKLAKKLGLKIKGNVTRARRKVKKTYAKAKTRYRRKK